jgi:hypothetical protein
MRLCGKSAAAKISENSGLDMSEFALTSMRRKSALVVKLLTQIATCVFVAGVSWPMTGALVSRLEGV